MYNNCDIVKDLIPLYAEHLLSNETGEFVDEHCRTCPKCNQNLIQAINPLNRQPAIQYNSAESVWSQVVKRNKKRKRNRFIAGFAIGLCIAVLLVFFRSCFLLAVGSETVSYDERTYIEMAQENTVMPLPSSLENYKKINYKFYHKEGILTNSNAYTLLAGFDNESYQKQKAEIQNSYTFRTSQVDNSLNDEPEYKELEPKFNYNGFEFNLLSEVYDDGFFTFPKLVYIIGFNDSTNQIAFIYFKDMDIDFIYSYEEFLEEDCGFEW